MHPIRSTIDLARLAAFLIPSAIAAATASAQCSTSFTGSTGVPGLRGTFLATTDFNADGRPDIAISSLTGPNTVAVLLNQSGATFAAPININIPGSSSQGVNFAVADFNNDGRPDIAAVASTVNTLSIILNTGNGTFAAPVQTALGAQPYSIVAADFNNDGKQDLAIAGAGTNGVIAVFFGNGNGTFAAPVSQPFVALTMITGDVNGDGRTDLIASNPFAGTVSVLLGTGATSSGAFTAGQTLSIPSASFSSLADLNADGRPDLIVNVSSSVAVYAGQANGTFTSVGSFPSGGSNALPAMAADYNGDGKVDLAVTVVNGDIYILAANGAGSAISFATPQSITPTNDSFGAVTADFNGDGVPDIAQQGYPGNGGGDALFTYVNTSAGYRRPTILAQPLGAIAPVGSSASLTAAAAGFGPSLTYRWRRNGVQLNNGGNISGATTATLTISPVSATDVATYDLDVFSASACVTTGPGAIVSTRTLPAVLGVTGISTPSGCTADLGAAGGLPGHDNLLDNNDFIAFINAFFNHTGCP